MNSLAPNALAMRAIAGTVAAIVVASLALRTRLVTRGGAIAATAIGGTATAAGWGWSATLIVYFLASAALTRWRHERKAARTRDIVEKGGARDTLQVLANGGLFCFAALLAVVHPLAITHWLALGAGALAVSAADTWATEVGIAIGGVPRSIVTGRAVPPGTSGGVSLAGSFAALCGAACIAGVVVVVGWPAPVALAAFAGGVAGAFGDSLIGATLQERRRCPACERPTERHIHECGCPTQHVGGIVGLDNDAVNLVASLAGGLLALALAG